MHKKPVSIMAFTLVWVFAISMLSNCYCSPSEAPVSHKEKAASHCHPSSNDQKNSDCAPRFQTDNFENTTLLAKTVEAPATADLILTKEIYVVPELPEFSLSFESPPVSPPEFFVLHHSFLI